MKCSCISFSLYSKKSWHGILSCIWKLSFAINLNWTNNQKMKKIKRELPFHTSPTHLQLCEQAVKTCKWSLEEIRHLCYRWKVNKSRWRISAIPNLRYCSQWLIIKWCCIRWHVLDDISIVQAICILSDIK